MRVIVSEMPDGKRKTQSEGEAETTSPAKCRMTNNLMKPPSSDVNTATPGTVDNTESLMRQMFTKIMGIKTTVNNLNAKMEEMQNENKQWKEKLGLIENEVKTVGESAASAHIRIDNEEKLRKEEIEKIHVKLQE